MNIFVSFVVHVILQMHKCCVRASFSLYVWWKQKSNVPLHNYVQDRFHYSLFPTHGSSHGVSCTVFSSPHPGLVSHWGLSPRTQLAPQPCISHHRNLFLPFLITCLNTNCSYTSNLHWVVHYFNTTLLPSGRWSHLHEVKDTNLKNTKQVLQNEPSSEIRP